MSEQKTSPAHHAVPLLPCPFCGGVAEFIYDDGEDPGYRKMRVECREADCGAQLTGALPADRTGAAKIWNRRA